MRSMGKATGSVIRLLLVCLLAVVLLAFLGCAGEKTEKVKLKGPKLKEEAEREKPVRIAIGSMISPKETFTYYNQILDYVSKKLDRPVELVHRETYQEVNDLLEAGEIDCAFVCSGPYVDGHDKFGLQLLVAPVSTVYDKPVYYSYIIVPKDSQITQLKQLKGKKFAFTDPLSNTGELVPTYMLAKIGQTPDSFFSKYIYTHSHDRSIQAVAEKIVDGAGVHSLIWEYFNIENPVYTSETKIIQKSSPYGIPPVVVTKKTDPTLKKQLKEIFLEMHQDEEGKKILGKLLIEKFIVVSDSDYDSVREMKVFLKKRR